MLGAIFGEQWVGQQRFTPTAQIDALHAAIEVRPRAAVLDLWCGAGGPAIYLAQQTGCRVIGIDPSVDNVRRARAAAAVAGLTNQVHFFIGTLATVPMPTASFDAIVCHDAFFPVENKLRLLANCSRLLRPGARMACTALVDRGELASQLDRTTRLTWSLTTAGARHANRSASFDAPAGIAQPLLTADDYRAIATLAGLHVLAADDLTASLRVVGGRWFAALLIWEEELIAELGQAPFEHLRATTGQLAEWAVQGLIGQIRLVAQRESEDRAAHSSI
jgi:SAM-dependent methyltransferase